VLLGDSVEGASSTGVRSPARQLSAQLPNAVENDAVGGGGTAPSRRLRRRSEVDKSASRARLRLARQHDALRSVMLLSWQPGAKSVSKTRESAWR